METRNLILEGRVGDLDVRFELGEGVHIAGRAAGCDVLLSESSISRRHAEIEVRGGRARLRDLGSHNGTQINGKPVDGSAGDGWQQLEPGDRLTLGRAALTVGGKQDSRALMTFVGDRPSTGVAITWHEIAGRDRGERLAPRGGGKRAELFTVLAEAGSLLVSPGAPEDLFEPILDLVDAAMAPERALIVLLDENDGEPQVRASRVRGGGAADNIMLSRTVIERVLGERVSFLIEDAQRDAALQAQMSIISQGLHTAMAAPLFDNQSVIGLLYADSADTADRYTTDELKAFTLLANCIAVALTHARYHAMEAEKQRLDAELGAARRIMATLLPAEAPAVGGWELLTHLESCTEVGGDLYDVFPLPDGRLAVVIGDVAGKGLGAALLVSSLLPLLRGLAGTIADPSDLVHRLNAVLFAATEPIRYATLFVGLLDPATGELAYVNAGHNPPYVVRGDGAADALAGTGLPVALLDDGVWGAGAVALAPGDLLALYTDGIPEAWNADDEDYGDERLRDLLASLRGRPAGEVRDAVLADVKAFVGEAPTSDDVTLVLLRRLA